MLASPHRFAIVHELRGAPEPGLAQQLARLAPADLTLVEGFKLAAIPRIEVHRPTLGLPLLHGAPGDGFVAVATDAPLGTSLRQLALNDPGEVAAFVCAHFSLG
jgi:molybdopterin-guanine dinucleotide biosynthesis protein B